MGSDAHDGALDAGSSPGAGAAVVASIRPPAVSYQHTGSALDKRAAWRLPDRRDSSSRFPNSATSMVWKPGIRGPRPDTDWLSPSPALTRCRDPANLHTSGTHEPGGVCQSSEHAPSSDSRPGAGSRVRSDNSFGIVPVYRGSGMVIFASGVIATVAAYVYYELVQNHGWPWPLELSAGVLLAGLLALSLTWQLYGRCIVRRLSA